MRCVTAILVYLAIGVPVTHAEERDGACALLSAQAIGSALGVKVSGLTQSTTGAAAASGKVCVGSAPNLSIMLRLAPASASGEKETKGIEAFRKMGGQVDVQKFGPITCSALTPPDALVQQLGFNTTCTVRRENQVGGIEVTAKERRHQVSIDRLRPLAEEIAKRL